MINKNRPITLDAKMMSDHNGADILVTLTLMPFTTTPYRVDVQWSDKEMSVYVDRFPETVAFHTENQARECYSDANTLGCDGWKDGGCIHDWHGHGKGPKYADGYGYHAPEEKFLPTPGISTYYKESMNKDSVPASRAFKDKVNGGKPLPLDFEVESFMQSGKRLTWYPDKLRVAVTDRLRLTDGLQKAYDDQSEFEKTLHRISGMLAGWQYGDGDLGVAIGIFDNMCTYGSGDGAAGNTWCHDTLKMIDADASDNYW